MVRNYRVLLAARKHPAKAGAPLPPVGTWEPYPGEVTELKIEYQQPICPQILSLTERPVQQ